MPRNWQNRVKVETGQTVGYSLVQRDRDPFYLIKFLDKTGRKIERSTGRTSQKEATDRAEEIISKEYEVQAPRSVLWDDAIERLRQAMTAAGNKPRTIKAYLADVALVRKFYTAIDGPADITTPMAQSWLTDYTNNQYAKSAKEGATKRSRSGFTVGGRLNTLSVVWSKWFIEQLQICGHNPWEELEPPKTDKPTVRAITDQEIAEFFAWLDQRFHGWRLPILFFTAKMITGCRLLDLCSIKSNNLVNGQLVFPADVTKGRKERRVPLPKELFDELKEQAGMVWLWECYPAQLRAALKRNGWPSHRLQEGFCPERFEAWLFTLLADYRADHPDREHFGTHAFRKRAFTRTWQAKIDPKRASIAYGCNVDTMMKHYVQLDEQATTDEVFAQMAGILNNQPVSTLSPLYFSETPPNGGAEPPKPSE